MGFDAVELHIPRKEPVVADCSRATGGHFLDPATEHFLWWQNLCKKIAKSMMHY